VHGAQLDGLFLSRLRGGLLIDQTILAQPQFLSRLRGGLLCIANVPSVLHFLSRLRGGLQKI